MKVHAGLLRQGPGSTQTTERALDLLPPLPPEARVYDMGCGPGLATLVLAQRLKQKIVALDLHHDFIQSLKDQAAEKGLSALIEPKQDDMTALEDAPESIHLIWAEGSIYCAGFDKALSRWRPLLTDKGLVACSELSWLTDSPAEEAKNFWLAAYPGIRSIAQNIAAAKKTGYKCFDHFILPVNCWWDEYYDPLLRNLERLKAEAAGDFLLAQAIEESRSEIDLFRRFSHQYGYVFYLLQKSN